MRSDIENEKIAAKIDVIDDIALALGSTASQLTNGDGFIITKKHVDSKQ